MPRVATIEGHRHRQAHDDDFHYVGRVVPDPLIREYQVRQTPGGAEVPAAAAAPVVGLTRSRGVTNPRSPVR